MINLSLLWTDKQLKKKPYVLLTFKHKIKLKLFHNPFSHLNLIISLTLKLTDLSSCWEKHKTQSFLNRIRYIGSKSEEFQNRLKLSNKFSWLTSLSLKKETWISKSFPTTNGDWSSFCIVYKTQLLFCTTLKTTF